MKPIYVDGTVRAKCPDCHAVSNFIPPAGTHPVPREGFHTYEGHGYYSVVNMLVECGACGRGGLAALHHNGRVEHADVEFYPPAIDAEPLPSGTPAGVVAEYGEAELCASARAWRAGSALLRSALEKLLSANGYTEGKLYQRIEAAATDGIVAEALKDRAHSNVRVLGNDVVHEDWRPVSPEEYEAAHHYVHRVAEAFYDNRPAVEALLKKANRTPA